MDRLCDFCDDTSSVIFKSFTDVPEFVKQASMEDMQRDKKLLFADEVNQKYPLDTPADIWLSNAYLNKTASTHNTDYIDRVREKINEAARFWSVDLSEPEKQASVDYSGYAVLAEDKPLYPLHNMQLVKKANEVFPENLDGEYAAYRTKVARMIASKLDETHWSPAVREYLPIARSSVIEDLDKRASMTDDPEVLQGVMLLKAASLGVQSEPDGLEFIQFLEYLDKKANIQETDYQNIRKPMEYIRLIHNDITPRVRIKSANDIPFEQVLTKKASLLNFMDVADDPYVFEMELYSLPQSSKKYVQGILG